MDQQGGSLSDRLGLRSKTPPNRSQLSSDGNPRTASEILQAITQDLGGLHQGLIAQLTQEVDQLQAEKNRLSSEIEQLQTSYQSLHSEQQLAQQQLWAKQLAQVLANHLQVLIIQRLNEIASLNAPVGTLQNNPTALSGVSSQTEAAHRLMASLDATFSSTFRTLQNDLGTYQSALSQQLNRMQSMEQQGEAILAALVDRLRSQAQVETGNTSVIKGLVGNAHQPTKPESISTAKPIPIEFPGAPLSVPAKPPQQLTHFQLGLVLVLVSTIALSIHNVVVRIIGKSSNLFGVAELGGFIQLQPGNSLLILWLRMLVVLPLMVPVAMVLYPSVWRDIKLFLTDRDRRSLYSVVGSGVFLFMSQILIYIAIGEIGPGAAVTILFMYPLVTVPLAWLLFNDRPTRLRWIVMAVISLGVILTAIPRIDPRLTSGNLGGVAIALLAGVAFAFYLILMQLGFKKLHPIPVSLVQFSTIFLLSSVILILPLDLGVNVAQSSGFFLGGVVLGVLTLIGYLANNFGVRFMGAARASIIASSGPAVTALLAWLIINDQLRSSIVFGIPLPVQILGILLVTLGVTALSFERMKTQPPAAKPSKS
jgi:drug/metabolite transporter (DMT)-like permease